MYANWAPYYYSISSRRGNCLLTETNFSILTIFAPYSTTALHQLLCSFQHKQIQSTQRYSRTYAITVFQTRNNPYSLVSL